MEHRETHWAMLTSSQLFACQPSPASHGYSRNHRDRDLQTINCPVEEAAWTGDVTIYGNGVIATPAAVPAQQTGSVMGTVSDSMPGTGSGTAENNTSGASGPGRAGAGGSSPAVIPVPVPHNDYDNAGPGSSSPAPNSGSEYAPGAALAPAGGEAGGSSPTRVIPQSNAGTDAASSPYVAAGAPSLKSALLIVSGLFALASDLNICHRDNAILAGAFVLEVENEACICNAQGS
ncbi:hypothetical protein DHEL01_v202180 [Diaporthe helianthi]|uniref:Uncharacterized protein n=1 Tax=Diaporthe helianthi TaxID=158607 RepID=A0A2P5IAA0_DIAHE|nr:hypothetical protein DHEL01_v202180 [Diaporthe helianthi]